MELNINLDSRLLGQATLKINCLPETNSTCPEKEEEEFKDILKQYERRQSFLCLM